MTRDDAGSSSLLASAPSYAGPWTNLKPPLESVLFDHITSTLQFSQMTPVQSSVIPLFLSHRDVIVEAVTGSGKTLAYTIPVLQMILRRNRNTENRLRKSQIGGLIICPTRELAIQVHGVLQDFIKSITPEDDSISKQAIVSDSLLLVGGSASSPADDYRRFKEQGNDIIVGTPGRVEELLKRSSVDVKELEVLILDEADRLLDLGFSQTIQVILDHLPKQRRTGLFSATMTDALGELARVGLRNPVRVVVKVESKGVKGNTQIKEDRRTPASLQNFYLACRAENKLMQLVRLLRRESFAPSQGNCMARKSLVYFSTCAQVNYFYKVLSKAKDMQGIQLYSLHGQLTPSRRTATFDTFVAANPTGTPETSSEAASVLFCTDVAARGLDLPNVDLVIQFDPPTDPKVFSHRCGRTARAGRHGRAVVFLLKGREEDYVEFLRVRKSPVKYYPYLTNDKETGTEPQDCEDSCDDPGTLEFTKEIKSLVKQDRETHELSVKAFVSFIKCYKKHEASFIFREKDLDFGKMASLFCLLRLPKMPEIDRWRKEHKEEADNFSDEDNLQLDTFAYADKAREKQRLEALEKRKADQNDKKRISSTAVVKKKMRGTAVSETAWSLQKAQKEKRDERREKKARKRDYEKKQKSNQEIQQGIYVALSSNERDANRKEEDDEDWAQDEREAKKARRTKATTDSSLAGMQFDNL